MNSKSIARWFVNVDNHELAALCSIADWAKANHPEMECRGDEDCDHCVLGQFLSALKESRPSLPEEPK